MSMLDREIFSDQLPDGENISGPYYMMEKKNPVIQLYMKYFSILKKKIAGLWSKLDGIFFSLIRYCLGLLLNYLSMKYSV
jgi:hypothetical protein